MKMNLEKKVQELEKKVQVLENKMAALEGSVQAQPRKFVPEDSDRKYYTTGISGKR